jgi:hypothetical protein
MDRRSKKQNILSGISARVKNGAAMRFVGGAVENVRSGELDGLCRER